MSQFLVRHFAFEQYVQANSMKEIYLAVLIQEAYSYMTEDYVRLHTKQLRKRPDLLYRGRVGIKERRRRFSNSSRKR